MWFTRRRGILLMLLACFEVRECWAITNAQFNASLRDYSAPEDSINTTQVRTLQKDLSEKYAHRAPVSTIIRFKEVPDSVLSGSSHSRGLLHLKHHGYSLADYDENPHYGYGYDYQYSDDHHGHYDHDHHHPDHHGHHAVYHDDHKHGHGYHHKHFDHHGLAAKTVLWPIAGIALLGAAAALVTNPVLLQLGVVSGRRKRDAFINTDRIDKPRNGHNDELILNNLKNFNRNNDDTTHTKRKTDSDGKINVYNKIVRNDNHKLLISKVIPTTKAIKIKNAHTTEYYNRYLNDKHYIPIPLMLNENIHN